MPIAAGSVQRYRRARYSGRGIAGRVEPSIRVTAACMSRTIPLLPRYAVGPGAEAEDAIRGVLFDVFLRPQHDVL